VATSFAIATTIDSFDQAAFRSRLRTLFPRASDILISFHAASVVANVRLVMRSEAEMREAETTLAHLAAESAATLASTFQAPITSATLPTVEVVYMPAPSPPPPISPPTPSPPTLSQPVGSPSPGEPAARNESVPVVMISVAIGVLLFGACGCFFACVCMTKHSATASGHGTSTKPRRHSAVTLQIDRHSAMPTVPSGPPPDDPPPFNPQFGKQASGKSVVNNLVHAVSRGSVRRGSVEETQELFRM